MSGRIPPTRGRTEIFSPGDGAVFLDTMVEPQFGAFVGDKNITYEGIVVDDERCEAFLRRHGEETGVDITSHWLLAVGTDIAIAGLVLRLRDDGTELRLRFPMPAAYPYLDQVIDERSLTLCCVRSERILRVQVTADPGPVHAAYAASLLAAA